MPEGKPASGLIKKAIFIACISLLFQSFFSFTAFAGGWWLENTPGQVDERNAASPPEIQWSDDLNTVNDLAPENGYWGAQEDNSGIVSPHGGYATTTNLCKTCHAVHLAGPDSYRLLKSGDNDFEVGEDRSSGEGRNMPGVDDEGAGDSRATECMYCHDATAGASDARPYSLGLIASVRGEHTIGATVIPDSNVNTGGANVDEGNYTDRDPVTYNGDGAMLQCYQCHSVHGANTIGGPGYPAEWASPWSDKILRLDPAGDGDDLALNAVGTSDSTRTDVGNSPGTAAAVIKTANDRDTFETTTYIDMGYTNVDAEMLANGSVMSSFCADCHNRNPNWDMSDQKKDETWYAYANSDRPNPRSHVQGPKAEGILEVYGVDDVAVAAHLGEEQGCRGCHTASDGEEIPGTSLFPHQSVGWKLMWDVYTNNSDFSELAGEPRRALPNMDRVCLMCHPVDGQFEEGKSYADVNTEQNLCFRCHMINSFAGAPDVKTEISKASRHPTNDYSGLHINSDETPAQLGGANRHAECLDCHNTAREIQGQGEPLLGTWGVAPSYSGPGAPTGYTKTSTSEYEVCFKCHSSYVTQRSDTTYSGATPIYQDKTGADLGQEDKALSFNPNNTAFHPIQSKGRNASSNLNSQLTAAGLADGVDTIINCTDCHNTNETSDVNGQASGSSFKPKGPHGSDYRPILRANYWPDFGSTFSQPDRPDSWDPDNFGLCFLCHDVNKLTDAVGFATNFSSGSVNLHRVHLVDMYGDTLNGYVFLEGAVCRDCHYDVHSNQTSPNTIYEYWGGASYLSSSTPPNGIKTHMVNFGPHTGGALNPALKARWRINQTGSAQGGLSAGARRCGLGCHLKVLNTQDTPDPSDDVVEYIWEPMTNLTYKPAAGDDPSHTF